MTTSRAVVFHGPNRPFSHETVIVPALREGEFLVRNEYTTLCRSDLNTFCGKRNEKTPTILGHEVVGRIEAVGPGAPREDCRGNPLHAGDRITWAIYAANPSSELARRGMPQKAGDLFKYGHERITDSCHLHGGLAEHCVLRAHTPIVRLDTTIPLALGALINCSVATVAGSLRLVDRIEGQNVIVCGAGMLGLIACAMSCQAGAREVIAVDIHEDRLSTAEDFGASRTVLLGPAMPTLQEQLAPFLAGESVTVAMDYSGVPDSMEMLLDVLGIGGALVLVGATYPQRPITLSAEQVVRRLHTIKGLHNYNQSDLVAGVEFIEKHFRKFPFEQLVDDRFSLEQVDEAFNYALTSRAYRVGIRI